MGIDHVNNFHIYGNAILNVSNPFNPGSYTNITGRSLTGIGEFFANEQHPVPKFDLAITTLTPGTVVFTWGALPWLRSILLPLRDYLQFRQVPR